MKVYYRIKYMLNGKQELTGLLPGRYIKQTILMLEKQGATDIVSYEADES